MAQESNSNGTTASAEQGKSGQGKGQQGKNPKKAKAGQKGGQAKAAKAPRQPRQKKPRQQRATPAHMSKVEKVARQLPPLMGEVQEVADKVFNLSTADMNALVAHINVEIRRRSIRNMEAAQLQGRTDFNVGDRVKIVGGDPRLVGKTGTVSVKQRIRCYVKLDGKTYAPKENGKVGEYLFITEVAPENSPAARLTNLAPQQGFATIEDEDVNGGAAAATG